MMLDFERDTIDALLTNEYYAGRLPVEDYNRLVGWLWGSREPEQFPPPVGPVPPNGPEPKLALCL